MRFAIPFARWRTALHDGFARFPLVLLCSGDGAGSLIWLLKAEHNPAVVGPLHAPRKDPRVRHSAL